MTTQTLAPGSQARIYRDGETLVANCLVPAEGRFEVRGLAPGQYVARDEQGGEQPFEVHVGEELTVVAGHGPNVSPGASGMPGTGSTVAAPALHVGPSPAITTPERVAPGEGITSPVANESKDVERVPRPGARVEPDNDPADDVRVPAQHGTALVQEVPTGVGPQLEEGQNFSPAEHAAMEAAQAELEGEPEPDGRRSADE